MAAKEPPHLVVLFAWPVVAFESWMLDVLLFMKRTRVCGTLLHGACRCLQAPYSCTCWVLEVVAVILSLLAVRHRRTRPCAYLLPSILLFAIVDASRAYATYTPLVNVGYRSGALPSDVPVHVHSTTLLKPRDTGPIWIRNFNALWAHDPTRRSRTSGHGRGRPAMDRSSVAIDIAREPRRRRRAGAPAPARAHAARTRRELTELYSSILE